MVRRWRDRARSHAGSRGERRKSRSCCSRTRRRARIGAPAPILPLVSKRGRTIALIGPLADSARDMLGCWSAQGIPDDVITLRAALAERTAAEGMRLLYAEGSKILGDDQSGFDEAVRAGPQGRRDDPRPRRAGRSNRRGRLASPPGSRWPATEAARGDSRHRQAGHRRAVQRPPAHRRVGGRACDRDRRRLVPGRGGGPGARANALR